MPSQSITLQRLENAMVLVALHIDRHIKEQGSSPFTVIFERLERERDKLLQQQDTQARAQAFLAHRTSGVSAKR